MREKMIEHHVKYKEIHGIDKTIWLTRTEHSRLHSQLREKGGCNISSKELQEISRRAANRTDKGKDYQKKYRWTESYKEYQKEYQKEYRKKNKEMIREQKTRYMREYRARKKLEASRIKDIK